MLSRGHTTRSSSTFRTVGLSSNSQTARRTYLGVRYSGRDDNSRSR